jgi:hypothetical protein
MPPAAYTNPSIDKRGTALTMRSTRSLTLGTTERSRSPASDST